MSAKKIGVLIEKHFDETEFTVFNSYFPCKGYEVEYLSYLWGAESLTFDGNDFKAQVEVRKCISKLGAEQLAEYAGNHAEAAAVYADAAERWRAFGNVPEEAYAHLGHGRCLAAIGDAAAAEPFLRARDLFQSLGYRPALAETEALLADATPAAS